MLRSASYLLPLLYLPTVLQAQDCDTVDLITPQFSVEVEEDVLYGTAILYNGEVDSLYMNIHRPVGDGMSERPLLIAIHGGAFMSGDREDMDELCGWYAARGYVAATVSYRLGLHPPAILPNPYAYDEAEPVRAAYRAQQDVSGAIRFLRARHEVDRSSLENVFLYGVSAGGIAAMHVAYATEENDKPAACAALDVVDHGTAQYPRPDLGPVAGLLNLNGYDARVKACVSHLGALLDTALVGSVDEPALFTYHQTGDPIVGCGHERGLWGAPLGIGANYPLLFGSCAIDPRMRNLGFGEDRYEFHPYTGSEHGIHDILLVDGLAAAFLARQSCSPTTATNETEAIADILTYPSPASDLITVRHGLSGTTTLQLLTMDGRTLSRAVGTTLAVGDVAAGSYLLNIRAGGQQWVRHVVVAH